MIITMNPILKSKLPRFVQYDPGFLDGIFRKFEVFLFYALIFRILLR